MGQSKVYADAQQALAGVVRDGMTLMCGGFGLWRHTGEPDPRPVSIGCARTHRGFQQRGGRQFGLGLLLTTRQIGKMISSYVGENKEFERQYLSGELELEFTPQGTRAERMRAGGAGIPVFYAHGFGTIIADDKEQRVVWGDKEYVMERSIRADLSLVKAWKADKQGNLVYRKTARNFNPMMATAGRVTIAEVEELVEPGQLEPDHVHTPGIYVQRIIQGTNYLKTIEHRTVRKRSTA